MIKDKRIIKTRAGIKSAYMQLCVEIPKEKISVSALTAKAQINRSTFYLHYKDVKSVEKDIEQEINSRVASCITGFDIAAVYESTYTTLTRLTDILDENPILKDYLLKSCCTDEIINRLKDTFTYKIVCAVEEKHKEKKREKIIYPATFMVAGIMDTYIKWAHSDKSTTLEMLIKEISALTNQIITHITA